MTNNAAMTIAVEFEVREESASTFDWLETWGVRANDALEHEPDTTAYEAAIASDASNRVLVFERYEGGETTLREHMKRPAHEALMEKMKSSRMTRRRPWMAIGYEVDDFGWLVRRTAEDGIMGGGLVIAMTAMRCPDSKDMVEACRIHAENSLTEDTGMLLYGLSRVSLGDQKDFDLKEGDLLVSRVFCDRKAHEADSSSDFWQSVRKTLTRLRGELIFSRHYITTGRGYIWRPGQA